MGIPAPAGAWEVALWADSRSGGLFVWAALSLLVLLFLAAQHSAQVLDVARHYR
jgi:hypothetical protein